MLMITTCYGCSVIVGAPIILVRILISPCTRVVTGLIVAPFLPTFAAINLAAARTIVQTLMFTHTTRMIVFVH